MICFFFVSLKIMSSIGIFINGTSAMPSLDFIDSFKESCLSTGGGVLCGLS